MIVVEYCHVWFLKLAQHFIESQKDVKFEHIDKKDSVIEKNL